MIRLPNIKARGERQTGRQTDRQNDRQIECETEGETNRQTDRQTETFFGRKIRRRFSMKKNTRASE